MHSVFFSCDKNDDITVTINESGSLEMKIVDDDKKPVENAVVTLIDVNTGSMIIKEETNPNGIFELEKILQGSYKCFISTEKGGKMYTITSYFQIFSNIKKTVEYNPFSNLGKVNVSVNIRGTVKDITKYIVAVVPMDRYINDISVIKKSAYFSAPLNEKGEVQISNIPADRQYILCAYKDNDIYTYQSFLMEKKEIEVPLSFEVAELNVTVDGEIANYGAYEVLITPYLSYISDVTEIRANTLYSGKLDSKGKITITDLVKSRDYNVYLVKDNKVFDVSNFYFNGGSLSKDVTLKVGSISIKVQSNISNLANYYIALSRNYSSDVNTLKDQAFANGKLDSNANIKFTELPTLGYLNNSFYMHLYKDNKVYDYSYYYWKI